MANAQPYSSTHDDANQTNPQSRVHWQKPSIGPKRKLTPDTPLAQKLISDLASDHVISDTELDAIEQLLGPDIANFMAMLG